MATIIFKATERCNSNCAYCDVIIKKQSGISMSYKLLELSFKRINEYLENNPDEKVSLVWHGGEPLILGVEYYKKALFYQKKYCKNTKSRIEHAIQSNLTLITKEFIDVLKEMGINSIGTSYDPEPHIRGYGKNIDSDTYNRMFIKGISLLEENNIGYGFIYVVTKKSLKKPLDIFFFLTNLKLSGGFSLNPVIIYDEERKYLAVTPKEYADFLGEIFPYWWKNMKRFPEVQPFSSYIKTIRDGDISLGCCDSGNCAYYHVNIDPLGETSQCGRSSDWGLLSYGNIRDKTLDEIINDEQRKVFIKRNDILKNSECKNCRFWFICHGGCLLDSYSKHKDFMHKTEWCLSKKRFMEKYFEPITGLKVEKNE